MNRMWKFHPITFSWQLDVWLSNIPCTQLLLANKLILWLLNSIFLHLLCNSNCSVHDVVVELYAVAGVYTCSREKLPSWIKTGRTTLDIVVSRVLIAATGTVPPGTDRYHTAWPYCRYHTIPLSTDWHHTARQRPAPYRSAPYRSAPYRPAPAAGRCRRHQSSDETSGITATSEATDFLSPTTRHRAGCAPSSVAKKRRRPRHRTVAKQPTVTRLFRARVRQRRDGCHDARRPVGVRQLTLLNSSGYI